MASEPCIHPDCECLDYCEALDPWSNVVRKSIDVMPDCQSVRADQDEQKQTVAIEQTKPEQKSEQGRASFNKGTVSQKHCR